MPVASAQTAGQYIHRSRVAAGLTQTELAARAGIDQSYLSRIERGKHEPSSDVIARLDAVFGETRAAA